MRTLSENELRGLMSHVPQYEDYATWLKVIAGTLELVGGNEALAESLLNEWQAENRSGLYRQKLRSFRGGSHGAGWLVNEAKRGGWEWPKQVIKDERLKVKDTVTKPLTIRSSLPKFYCDGAFFSAENENGFPLTIWVPAEYVGELNAGDVVICHGRGTKRELNRGGVEWTFWSKKVEKAGSAN